MKNISLAVLLLYIFKITQTTAQTVSLDFESGNRSLEQANCWVFGAFSYTNGDILRVNGNWSGRSNSMSNSSTSASWIKTPWFKPSTGALTFKTRLENSGGMGNPDNSNYKMLRVRFIPFDSNASYGEGDFLADSTDFVYISPYNTVRTISVAIPASIANSNQPYKVMISFFGKGGNNRALVDDLVIPGTYWADPNNNCLPQQLETDSDGDGVTDQDDAYPNDPYKVFNNYYPANGFSTLLFEDLWPRTGDYDLNDLVLDYQFNIITNKNNEIVEILYTFVTRAIGAGLKNGFAFQLDGINPNKITSVTGTAVQGAAWVQLNNNGTESGQEFANIIVMDNVFKRFNAAGVPRYINVDPTLPTVKNDTIVITVKLLHQGVAPEGGTLAYNDLGVSLFNPYLIADQDRGKEIHLANRIPSAKMNQSYFGQFNDNSNPASNRYFVTPDNLPWALQISNAIPYPIEKKDFTTAFLKFSSWAESGGTLYSDWYLNNNGYRNNAVLIVR